MAPKKYQQLEMPFPKHHFLLVSSYVNFPGATPCRRWGECLPIGSTQKQSSSSPMHHWGGIDKVMHYVQRYAEMKPYQKWNS